MQERLQATISKSNKWHTKDVEDKAKELNMSKSDFILLAVQLLLNIDTQKLKDAINKSEESNQNDLIALFLREG
jgi:hypothetical protein